MKDIDKERCCEHVYRGHWSSGQCSRKAKVFVDGKGYCIQHSPQREEEKRKKWQREFDIRSLNSEISDKRNEISDLVMKMFKNGTSILGYELKKLCREICELEDEVKKIKEGEKS